MPFAVALLCHPAGAYACLVTALAAFVYAWHTRRFVPSFTAASAGALTTLAFYGAALVAGCATTVAGSWRLLAAMPDSAPAPRLAIAIAGTSALLAAVLRGFRLRTLGGAR